MAVELVEAPSAASELALSLGQMPYLTNLELRNATLPDLFYSSLNSSAPYVKVFNLAHSYFEIIHSS